MMKCDREGNYRIPSGCAISGVLHQKGKRFDADLIVRSIDCMRERSNGLGGGFAAYGIYPEYAELFALHIIYDDDSTRSEAERIIAKLCRVTLAERIPVRERILQHAPDIWRYFIEPLCDGDESDQKQAVMELVMKINSNLAGAYVISSGQNMGVFKGAAYPDQIAEFYRLDDYQGYLWMAHGRFPTNTPGWWGGAHPFNLLDCSLVHNGEVSSYGANRSYLEMFDYEMTLQTDSEAIAYAVDLLHRRQNLPMEVVAAIFAPPFWEEIDRMAPTEREFYTQLRITYGSLLFNGPFSIIIGFNGGMMALNDRIKLRSLAAGKKGDLLLVASEEAALRVASPQLDELWFPEGGEPVIGRIASSISEVGAA